MRTARIVTAAQAVMRLALTTPPAPSCVSLRQPAKDELVEPAEPDVQAQQPEDRELQPAQRAAVMKLLPARSAPTATARSSTSCAATKCYALKAVAEAGGRGGGPAFGEDEYYLAFLGTPSTTTPWMLQFGGHHLAINLTMAREPGEHDAEPARRAARDLHVSRAGRCVRSATRTTRRLR